MFRQSMQHMIQKPNSGIDGYLLTRRELCSVRGIFLWKHALFRSGLFFGRLGGWEVVAFFKREQDAAVEGEGDLDFGLVGDARDGHCAAAESHCDVLRLSDCLNSSLLAYRSWFKYKCDEQRD